MYLLPCVLECETLESSPWCRLSGVLHLLSVQQMPMSAPALVLGSGHKEEWCWSTICSRAVGQITPKLKSLKQQMFIISHSFRGSGVWELNWMVQGLSGGCSQAACQGCRQLQAWRWLENLLPSSLNVVVGRPPFLTNAGLFVRGLSPGDMTAGFPQSKWPERQRQTQQCFYNPVSGVTFHHSCSALLITQTKPGTVGGDCPGAWTPGTGACYRFIEHVQGVFIRQAEVEVHILWLFFAIIS